MRIAVLVRLVAVAAVVAAGCSDAGHAPTVAIADDAPTAGPEFVTAQSLARSRAFVSPLRGSPEVPPVETQAVGSAGFLVAPNGQSIQFQLLVARLNNTTMAHIHVGKAGENGPVVVWLYPSGPPPVPIPGEFNGVLGEGVFTAANLVGPLAGEPLSTLINAMRAGGTYVNVHSVAFPAGEIRGQIVPFVPLD